MKPTEKIARDLDYQTPENILACVRDYFGGPIPLDPATAPDNPTKALHFCAGPHTGGVDGLQVSWRLGGFPRQGVFVNPPYGPLLKPFLAKIQQEACDSEVPILALLPVSRTEQGYFQDLLGFANFILFIRKRVAFVRPTTGEVAKGNPYSSWILGFNVDPKTARAKLGVLGKCLEIGTP